MTGSGQHDVRALACLLEQPVRAGKNPPQQPVWHASIRNHITDRTLTDAQWAHIAAEMVAAVGIAPHGDPDAVRWVAIRHADDHIHIVATLVRQDGNTVWAWNERLKAQAAARDLEERYGLYRVGPADRTCHRRPRPAELNKTQRQGRVEVPRDRLRRDVRAAAAASVDEEDFFAMLGGAGILVRLRRSTANPGEVTGYAVGLPDHHTAAGDTVWYGGGRLAPDMTLPQLRRHWRTLGAAHPPRPRPGPRVDQRADAFRRASAATQRAAQRITAEPRRRDRDRCGTARAASDLLVAAARAFEGRRGGPLTAAAETFDRAVREPYRREASRSHLARQIGSLARLIAAAGRLTEDRDTAEALQLILQLAMLAENLAELREEQQRLHQARAAREVAEHLRAIAATSGHTVGSSRQVAAGQVSAAQPRAAGRRSV